MSYLEIVKKQIREHVKTPPSERRLREIVLENLSSAESEHWSVIETEIILVERILEAFNLEVK
jgi:hypothetical protein